MLSINIPVYNFEVLRLVQQLSEQAISLKIDFEIRVYDDGSDEIIKSFNKNLQDIEKVVYVELEKNVGRAAIRNKMGFESKYENLLFIDADSLLVNENYLQNFIEQIKANRILCGGTAYSAEKPKDEQQLLRWIYGQKREAISADKRNRSKGFIITSNNFLIPKELFQQIHFRDKLSSYGHEDTLLGFDLYMQNCEIFHIQNPVEHTGLESAHLFLQKTKMALKNLLLVSEDLLNGDKNFKRQVNFLKFYSRITLLVPGAFLRWCYERYENRMELNLKSPKPNLRCFDFYKLTYYSTLKNR